MNQPKTFPPPTSAPAFRLHAGLVLEIYGPGASAKVQLSPRDALGIAQALIFDVREAVCPFDVTSLERTK